MAERVLIILLSIDLVDFCNYGPVLQRNSILHVVRLMSVDEGS